MFVEVTRDMILEALTGLTEPRDIPEKPGLLLVAGRRVELSKATVPVSPPLCLTRPRHLLLQWRKPLIRNQEPWDLFLGWLLGSVIRAHEFQSEKIPGLSPGPSVSWA